MTDVTPPDLETRIAILRRMAERESISAPHDVLEYIASKFSNNIRELEGALIRVSAYASLDRQSLDIAVAETVLRDLISDDDTTVTASTIIATTATYFSVSPDELTGPSRSHALVTARQIAVYLCRELTDLSLPKLGQQFHRDHTTVLYAERKIRALMAEKRSVFNQVTDITNRIKQQGYR
jgi:chromosomal replication initiator protein